MKNFLVILSLFVATIVNGQARVWANFGEEALSEGDYYGASRFFLKAWKEDSTYKNLVYNLGLSFKGYHNNEKALSYFKKIEKSQELQIAHPDYYFHLAEIYKSLGNYSLAKDYYEKSLRVNRDTRSFEYQKAKNEVKVYKNVLGLLNDTIDVKIENLGNHINTGVAEYYPVWINDSTIFYSALRAKNVDAEGVIKDKHYNVKIYNAAKKDSVWASQEVLFYAPFQNESYSDGSLDDNGDFYFSKQLENQNFQLVKGTVQVKEKIKGEDSLQVFELDTVIPIVFSELDGEYNFRNPFVFNRSGKKFLFFSSNMPGGKGGMDLWYSEQRGGVWGAPKNLGTKINTPGNEVGPNYNASTNRFYFSSDFHYGLGGFDVFEALGSWKRPASVINLGIPFNSSANDLYFAPLDSLNGLFTSAREGSLTDKEASCCNDLYVYKYPEPEIDSALLEITEVLSRDSIMKRLQKLVEEFHVTLYFHNDRPNPNNWDTITPYTYMETYEAYLDSMPTYFRRNTLAKHGEDSIAALNKITGFFDEYVHKGVEDLRIFTGELIKELDAGQQILLTVKGYASPLAKSDYNVNLTLRRINSLQNYLRRYPGGVFNKYLDGTANSGGLLKIKKIPFGEVRSDTTVSDNYYNTKQSVYSKEASLERKIEIINLELIEDSLPKADFSVNLDSAETVFNLGLLDTNEFEWRFNLQNQGDKPLKIESIEMSCHCLTSDRSSWSLEAGETEPLDIKFDLKDYSGKIGRRVILNLSDGTKRAITLYMDVPEMK